MPATAGMGSRNGCSSFASHHGSESCGRDEMMPMSQSLTGCAGIHDRLNLHEEVIRVSLWPIPAVDHDPRRSLFGRSGFVRKCLPRWPSSLALVDNTLASAQSPPPAPARQMAGRLSRCRSCLTQVPAGYGGGSWACPAHFCSRPMAPAGFSLHNSLTPAMRTFRWTAGTFSSPARVSRQASGISTRWTSRT